LPNSYDSEITPDHLLEIRKQSALEDEEDPESEREDRSVTVLLTERLYH
jgi:hypothetical protein